MNVKLTNEIVRHIFSNFGIVKTDFVNLESSKSLMDKSYLLTDKIKLDNDGAVVTNNVWGCQMSADQQLITILLGDVSIQDDLGFVLLINMSSAPTYAIYFSPSLSDVPYESALITCSVEDNKWFVCNTHLQATFLAAMEQIRDINFSWRKAENYNEQFVSLLSFIEYYDSLFEENNEG